MIGLGPGFLEVYITMIDGYTLGIQDLIWQHYERGADLCAQGAQWVVDRGNSINFWQDLWVGGSTFAKYHIRPPFIY